MSSPLEFETPENIRVSYQPAGLGTRYIAYLLDSMLLALIAAVMLVLLVVSGAVAETWFRSVVDSIEGTDGSGAKQEQVARVLFYFVGIFMLFWGFQGFVYYTISELWMRGQTIGKRTMGLRVIRVDGFALEPSSIVIRNIFRVIDEFPPVWAVILLSPKSQRLGDIVAGTTVIVDKPDPLSPIREALTEMPAQLARFSFDSTMLKRARPQDFRAIEQVLNRWDALPEAQRETLLEQIVPALVERMQCQAPPVTERHVFLEDLLAAELRRQHRNI